MIWFGDETGARYVSAEWCTLTGQGRDELEGWGWLTAVHPEDRDMLQRTQTEAAANAVGFTCRYRLKLPRRPDIWISAGAYPSFDSADRFIGFVGTADALKGSSRRLPSASLGERPDSRPCIEPTTIERIADHLLAARALLEAVDDKRLTDALDRTLLITGFRLAEQSGGR